MKILDFYVVKVFLRYFGLVLMVPGILFSLFELISQLDKAGKGTFTSLDAVLVVLLTLPERLIELIPVATFLGALAGLGRLSDQGELLAMEASGRSFFDVFTGIALGLGLVTFLALGTGEFVVPTLAQKAASLRLKAESTKELTYTEGGFWAKRNKTFLHVGNVASKAGAERISIYQFDDNGTLVKYIRADSAMIAKDGWTLQNVTVKEIKKMEIFTRRLSKLKVPSFLDKKDMKALELSPEDLSVVDLWSYVRALKNGGQNPDHFVLALWRKLTRPLFALCLSLLAAAFVYGSVRRGSMGPRIAIGLVVGLIFYFFDQITMQLGLLWGLPPVITAFIPVLISAAGSAVQIKRVM